MSCASFPHRSSAASAARALAALFALACAAATPSAEDELSPGVTERAAADEVSPGVADRDAPFELARLMADPEWIGRFPEDPWWAPDGRSVHFWRAVQGARGERELVTLDLESGAERVLEDAERPMAGAPGGEWDGARRRLVFAREGDLFVFEIGAPAPRQLTRTLARESDPLWLEGGARIAFQREGTWLARDLDSGLEEELAPLRLEDDPDADEPKRERGFLEEQQERLFEVVREQTARRTRARERTRELEAADATRAPRPWYLGAKRRIAGQSLAPDANALALRLAPRRAGSAARDAMAEWVTETGYVTTRELRPLVGSEPRAAETLVVLDLAARERIDVELGPLAERSAAETAAEGEAGASDADARDGDGSGAEDPRPAGTSFSRLEWSPDGARLAVMARSLDGHSRWIFALERSGRDVTLVHHMVDPAWLNWRFDALGWTPDGSGLWFLSEESGWSQLHLWDAREGTARALTSGEQEVDQVSASPDGRWLYYRSNHGHPGVQELWRVAARGGEPERLTSRGGQLSYWLAPEGERVLLRASRQLEPPELYVQDARPGAGERQLTRSIAPEFTELPWVRAKLVPVPSRHGRPVWSRLFLPPEDQLPPAGDRPAVLFVHGAGYLQSAHAGWPHYLRETLFHTLLARRGAVVLDMDYRASSGYGRDWRTAIHMDAGGPELDDLEDGLRWLVREHGVDPARVGVYGGSYGGFLVLQALFTRPELFACGAALRPVTDWAHYHHGYTANILGVPAEQTEAYARSSPIEHAEGLAAPLLICHGLVDDNVFAKDSVRLAQRLIELGKEDWELALYPVEPHAFRESSSWLDQYRRVLRLFERHLDLR